MRHDLRIYCKSIRTHASRCVLDNVLCPMHRNLAREFARAIGRGVCRSRLFQKREGWAAMGLFGKKQPPKSKAAAAKKASGKKGWVAPEGVGGASGAGWTPSEASSHGDGSGGSDRNSWSYPSPSAENANTPTGSSYGVHGNEAWNGGGVWENDAWNGRRERSNEW